jgi:hypothetical protein
MLGCHRLVQQGQSYEEAHGACRCVSVWVGKHAGLCPMLELDEEQARFWALVAFDQDSN